MAGLEDALTNQAMLNRALSEVDYESSVYKRFGCKIDKARRMREEYA